MRSIGPAVTREQCPAFLRNSNGRLDLPGPTQEAAWIPRRNSRILPQLEKIHVVPPSSQDVALCRYSVSFSKIPQCFYLYNQYKFLSKAPPFIGNSYFLHDSYPVLIIKILILFPEADTWSREWFKLKSVFLFRNDIWKKIPKRCDKLIKKPVTHLIMKNVNLATMRYFSILDYRLKPGNRKMLLIDYSITNKLQYYKIILFNIKI